MGISIFRATGKATCQLCKEKISKEEIAIKFTAYRVSEQYHYSCIQNKLRDYLTAERVEEMGE